MYGGAYTYSNKDRSVHNGRGSYYIIESGLRIPLADYIWSYIIFTFRLLHTVAAFSRIYLSFHSSVLGRGHLHWPIQGSGQQFTFS